LDFGAGNRVIGRPLGPRLCGFNWQWDLIDSGYQEEGGDVNYSMYKTVPSGKLYDLILAIDVCSSISEMMLRHLKCCEVSSSLAGF
jgi:hypothetical protein